MEKFDWNINLNSELRQPIRKIAFENNRPINHIVSDVVAEFLRKRKQNEKTEDER